MRRETIRRRERGRKTLRRRTKAAGEASTRTMLSDACMYVNAMTSSASRPGGTTPGSFVAPTGGLSYVVIGSVR